MRGDAMASRESIAAVAALPHLRIRGTLGADAPATAFARDCLVAEGALEADGEWRAVAEHEHKPIVGAGAVGDGGDLSEEEEVGEGEDLSEVDEEEEGDFGDEGGDIGKPGDDLQQTFDSLRWLSISAAEAL